MWSNSSLVIGTNLTRSPGRNSTMLSAKTGKRFSVSQIGTGVRAKIWYPPGVATGYMAVDAPPIPTVPGGVQVRGGLYLGAVMTQRGSSAIMKGRPGQKPKDATQYSVPEWTRTSCAASASPLMRATNSGSGSFLVILAQ